MRRAAALAVVALLVAPPGLAVAQCPRTSVADVEDEVLCPQCGVPLALATDAPQARAQREFVRRLVDEECASKQQVKDALVAQFGEAVLAEPGDDGFDVAAWLVPALAIVGAAAGIAFAATRWRRGRASPAQAAAAPGLAPEDAERLEADMERYER